MHCTLNLASFAAAAAFCAALACTSLAVTPVFRSAIPRCFIDILFQSSIALDYQHSCLQAIESAGGPFVLHQMQGMRWKSSISPINTRTLTLNTMPMLLRMV